jgi:hypothetical protein
MVDLLKRGLLTGVSLLGLATIALLALSFTAASPARANWAVIQFANGHCAVVPAIFWQGWPTIAVMPDWPSAVFERDWAIQRGICSSPA